MKRNDMVPGVRGVGSIGVLTAIGLIVGWPITAGTAPYVANAGEGSVSVADAATDTLTATILVKPKFSCRSGPALYELAPGGAQYDTTALWDQAGHVLDVQERPLMTIPREMIGLVSIQLLGGDEVVSEEWASHRARHTPTYVVHLFLKPAANRELSSLLSGRQVPSGVVGVCDGEVLGVDYPSVPFMGGLGFTFGSIEKARGWAAALADDVLEDPALWQIAEDRVGGLVIGRSAFDAVLSSLGGLCGVALGSRTVNGTQVACLGLRCGVTMTSGSEVLSRRIDLQAVATLDPPATVRTIYLTAGKAKTSNGSRVGDDVANFVAEFGKPNIDLRREQVCLRWSDHPGLVACLTHEDGVAYRKRIVNEPTVPVQGKVGLLVVGGSEAQPTADEVRLASEGIPAGGPEPGKRNCPAEPSVNGEVVGSIHIGDSLTGVVKELSGRFQLRPEFAESKDGFDVPLLVAECEQKTSVIVRFDRQGLVTQVSAGPGR